MTPDSSADSRAHPREKSRILGKLDRAATSYERARSKLDDLIADARVAGIPLAEIADHTPYSREWVRKIAARIADERSRTDPPGA